ncbi:SGF29 tudor-like domain-containing protein [Pilobolus umbonatus]|nr:SGF29 tudor-like domain-containing protein [Pilobolus umbonatus]
MDRKSRTSRSGEMNEEFTLWKEICSSLVKLEGIQEDEESMINTLNKTQHSINIEKGITSMIHQRLKDNYRRGIELSTNEARIIKDVIEKLSVLIALRNASEQDPKRKKRKLDAEDSLKVTKTNNNGILTNGTSVAAKQPKEKDKNEEWILATVIQYFPDKNKYQVEDVDQDEYGQKPRYMLPPRYVIPIPNSDEAKVSTEIQAHQNVLALYPGTTCFYKATVITPPSKNKDLTRYRVQFEDDNDEVQNVMPEYILEMPKK